MKVIPTGFWLHSSGFIGGSPDGLIGDDAIIEVKCPFKYKDSSLLEDIKTDHNYIVIADSIGNITVNKNHEYFQQIQGQLFLTKRKICYLVIWTPKEVVIVNIPAEDFSTNFEILNFFYLNHYVRFLQGEKYVTQ